MADHDSEARESKLESEVREMQLKEEDGDTDMDAIPEAGVGSAKQRSVSASGGGEPGGHDGDQFDAERASRSPTKSEGMDQSPAVKSDDEEVDVEVKLEAGTGKRKLTKSSHKVTRHAPALFSDYEDKTDEANSTFGVMTECSYANKYLGSTEHALECDCAEEWDSFTKTNQACGEDSDCINRATKMECLGDCGCGTACQNQRFLQKRYANVSVIKTEKKGYGLRANVDLKADDFIFEYIGEVIGENAFRKRMQNYDSEGIKHFYFMSLTKGEFVDATKRGNLGRFCNHSCAPNAYVDKWVVGDRLRMGIFAERKIQAGEEIVFNYNVDRYGADPQPCYCGEPNCTGFIGGKTQTERATKLSNTVIEALGIDDADSWDTAVAKKPRKKKVSEDDEEYVNNVEPRGLDEEGVNKVMSTLMQCKEKWIAVKLLTRIQRADDEKVRNRVVRFHGYRILKNVLSTFIDDVNVCLQVMEILEKMPRLTRNKIQDSKIEETVQELAKNEDERVSSKSLAMLQEWGKLELGYRIPRMKRDPNAVPSDRKTNRRDVDRRRSRSRTRSKSPDRMQAPTGPRNNAHQRAQPFPRPPPRFRPPMGGKLPPGWFEANAGNGSSYFYNSAGATTWQRPTMPAMGVPPPPPSKAVTDQQMLQDLIKNIVSTTNEPQRSASASGTPAETLKKEHKEEKWRSIPEDKRKKIYEGAIQPHIMHVVGKFKHKLEKEDLKRWAKELAKKIVESDFKNGRVQDPSKVGEKQIRNVKKHTLEFFQKATKKNEEAEKRRAHRKSLKKEASNTTTTATSDANDVATPIDKDGADMGDVTVSDDEEDSPAALKRRRPSAADGEDDSDSLLKRQRTGTEEAPPPPPPPPPPVDMPDIETADADQPLPDTNGDAHSGNIARTDQALAGAEDGLAYKLASRPTSAHDDRFKADLTQTATPPTTGSPDHEQVEQEARKRNFAGMNPDRMRQLGLDGANGE